MYADDFRADKGLIEALLQFYDADGHVFSIGQDKVDICFGLEDILYITSFPIDGKAVTGVEKSPTEICVELLGHNYYKRKGDNYLAVVPLNALKDAFSVIPDDLDVDSEEFKWYVRDMSFSSLGV